MNIYFFGQERKCSTASFDCLQSMHQTSVGSLTFSNSFVYFDPLHTSMKTGDSWNEQQRRGWKSKLPACEWEGITCDKNGEITGLAFPIWGNARNEAHGVFPQ